MVLMESNDGSTINRNNSFDVENGVYDGTTSTSLIAQIVEVLEARDSKWILGLIAYNIVIIYYVCDWVTSTNSIALSAYANTVFFNVFALLVCLISIWVERNSPANRNFRTKEPRTRSIFENSRLPKIALYPEYRKTFDSPLRKSLENFDSEKFDEIARSIEDARDDENFDNESISSLGLEKYEVLALLVSSCLSLMAGSLVTIELVGRLSDQPRVHTERLGLGALLGFLAHLGTIIGYPDAGLNHIVCKALPCPTLRGCNPILAGNIMSALILSFVHLVIHIWEIHITDTAAAFAVLGLTAMSMLPLAFYTSNVILQKLPSHMSEQLDKCLREALIIDGVLEFRNERFWTKSFGKLAGTLQVRIRRNANENHVLECVMSRLSKIVTTLTIREFHESPTNDITDHHPVEYYINEILSFGDENTNDASGRSNYRASRRDIDKDVAFARIEDIIGFDDSRIETFAIRSGKGKISYDRRDVKRASHEADTTISMRKLTIVKDQNIDMRDRLWRDDLTKKNALLLGTKIDFEKFDNFFVPELKSNENNEIIT